MYVSIYNVWGIHLTWSITIYFSFIPVLNATKKESLVLCEITLRMLRSFSTKGLSHPSQRWLTISGVLGMILQGVQKVGMAPPSVVTSKHFAGVVIYHTCITFTYSGGLCVYYACENSFFAPLISIGRRGCCSSPLLARHCWPWWSLLWALQRTDTDLQHRYSFECYLSPLCFLCFYGRWRQES